ALTVRVLAGLDVKDLVPELTRGHLDGRGPVIGHGNAEMNHTRARRELGVKRADASALAHRVLEALRLRPQRGDAEQSLILDLEDERRSIISVDHHHYPLRTPNP